MDLTNENLCESRAQLNYQLIFENTPEPYLILDCDLIVRAINQSALGILRRERSNIIDHYLFEVLPETSTDPNLAGIRNLKASLDRVLKSKQCDVMAIQKFHILSDSLLEEDRVERYYRMTNSPVLSAEGELDFIINTFDDMTDFIQMKKRANTSEVSNLELKDMSVFLESILNNIPNMVFVKEAKGLKFIKMNKAGEELLGISASELMNKNDYDFFPKVQADFFTSKDRAVFQSGKVLDIPEEAVMTKALGERILHTRKVPLYDENKNPLYLIGISEDITDRIGLLEAQHAQKAAEEMAERKVKFLDIAAHELRTPITSLTLLLQLAQKQTEKGTPLKIDLISKLREPAERLRRLVIDLLDMSRLERGLLTLLPQKTDLVLLVSKCIDDFRIQAPERIFKLVSQENIFLLELDPVRINQVVSNLLDNAVKYAPEGEIEVVIEILADSVKVSVIDHGPGISKDQQKGLFSPFSRGSSDATIKASGLGLGLSVCHGIISLHGGTMGVISDPGKGALFYFELPKKGVTLIH